MVQWRVGEVVREWGVVLVVDWAAVVPGGAAAAHFCVARRGLRDGRGRGSMGG